jgi:hypothetical protein
MHALTDIILLCIKVFSVGDKISIRQIYENTVLRF